MKTKQFNKVLSKTAMLLMVATVMSSGTVFAATNTGSIQKKVIRYKYTVQTTKPSTGTSVGTSAGTSAGTSTGTSTETTDTSNQTTFENEVLRLVNVERKNAGLTELQMDESIRSVARTKATDMYKNNYFSHTSPTYGTPFQMLKSYGITYKAAAENIAKGQTTPEQVVKSWMNSSGHKANILNAKYTHIGIGYEANGNHWVQMFVSK